MQMCEPPSAAQSSRLCPLHGACTALEKHPVQKWDNREQDGKQDVSQRGHPLRYLLSKIMMQIKMAMMAPVPSPAAATAPMVVQSPFSSHGHTFTLITDVLYKGGFPESVTTIGTSYTPASRYMIRKLSWA